MPHADRVLENLDLLDRLADQYTGMGVARTDLVHEGLIALERAALKFHTQQRDVPFRTYASWWIRHAIARTISDRKHSRA